VTMENRMEMELTVDEPKTVDAAVCPACGADVALAPGLMLGEIVFCEHCGVELEAISLGPVRLEMFEEEEK